MAVEISLIRLRELALTVPRSDCKWEEQPQFAPPATPQSIVKIESLAGFVLPNEFRTFLEQTNAVIGMSIHNGYWIGDVERLASDSFPRVIHNESVLPIATDGGGNAFLLSCNGYIWQWNHETGNVVQVATSFNAFLEQVVADWEAYLADTPDWDFLM